MSESEIYKKALEYIITKYKHIEIKLPEFKELIKRGGSLRDIGDKKLKVVNDYYNAIKDERLFIQSIDIAKNNKTLEENIILVIHDNNFSVLLKEVDIIENGFSLEEEVTLFKNMRVEDYLKEMKEI